MAANGQKLVCAKPQNFGQGVLIDVQLQEAEQETEDCEPQKESYSLDFDTRQTHL
jgi:hypothetical protein